MLSSYNRIQMSKDHSDEAIRVYGKSNFITGLEWNQYIGRIIINDFIKQLDEHDGTEFSEYMNVLPFIEYGLFQSAIALIQKIDIPSLSAIKEWLVKSLTEAEDRYE